MLPLFPKIRALRWWIIGLVMLGAIVNYLTRSTMGVAAPTVLKDLGVSVKEYSWITSAFQLGIMLQPVCGYVLALLTQPLLGQRSHRKRPPRPPVPRASR